MTSAQWVEYHDATKRKIYNALPTSDITAETVTVDGFALSQTNNAGESTSTSRSLAIQLNGTWYPAPTRLASQGARSQVCSRLGVWLLKSQPAYGWDLTKNICELYGTTGYIATDYTYSPYGAVTSSGNVTQPIQWSSEYHDTELGLVYYNYRHYNPLEGRWVGRDCLLEVGCINLYTYVINNPCCRIDILGMKVDSHHTKKCNGLDDCDKLKEGLDDWNKHYEKRYRELQEDQYNYKVNDIKRYNNHIGNLVAAKKNIQHCIKLMRKNKCNDCGGGDGVLIFEKYPIPAKLKEAEKESLFGNIDWSGIGAATVAGVGALALAAAAATSAPAAVGVAAVIVVSSVIIGNASDDAEV